jgi:hypothetical protein
MTATVDQVISTNNGEELDMQDPNPTNDVCRNAERNQKPFNM